VARSALLWAASIAVASTVALIIFTIMVLPTDGKFSLISDPGEWAKPFACSINAWKFQELDMSR